MTWNYETEYNKLLDTLEQDKNPWRPANLLPTDGTKVFLKCGLDYKGDRLFDFGHYSDYTSKSWYAEGEGIVGEWDTEFGNMEECTGWKLYLGDNR